MVLFVVRHQHAASTCPAGDPDASAMMLNHLSRSNVRHHGIEILGEAVVKGEHTFYMIVQAPDEGRLQRSCSRSRGSERPRFTRHRRARVGQRRLHRRSTVVESWRTRRRRVPAGHRGRPGRALRAPAQRRNIDPGTHWWRRHAERALYVPSQPFPYADAQSVHVAATGGGPDRTVD